MCLTVKKKVATKYYLFKRDINPNEKDFIAIVKVKLLYWIFDLDEKNCSCMGRSKNRKMYYNYLKKILEAESKAFAEKNVEKYKK